jgi:hypothetical protein
LSTEMTGLIHEAVTEFLQCSGHFPRQKNPLKLWDLTCPHETKI